ncbi:Serine-threonine/tyrosine-protein kinase, catalytic domain [Sesbania bispinosa]|nr:Serine-threonine/tyrosine-protein kinase, catalytic domain [Sesbania bispinosa]
MMPMFLHFLFVLLGVLTVVVLVQAQDQSDCGLPEKSSYTEKNTSINYISDAKFIDAGVSKSISPEEKIHHQQQLAHVRSFPSGVRNCYRINVTSGTKYLIRASFYYGNYDGHLHLGDNFWETVKFLNASLSRISEIIYTPSLDHIHLCLVNTGTGTPFISAIELRILNNGTYDTHSTDETLAIFGRYNFGTNHNKVYRYKDDVYDRLWGIDPFKFWKPLNTSLGPDDLGQNKYKPPAVVMSTAATPINASAPLEFSWDSDNVNEKYYIYMHFNEVEKLTTNESRAFDIYMNDKHWYGPLVPLYQITTTVLSTSALTGATSYTISLSKTENSTLPPIINAVEIYTVKDFSQSETQQDDVDAITNIKKAYGVARNWQGDPCAPVAYMWEGLNCSFDSNNPPRITSLNLSSSGLTGQIASSISKLTMLQYLDLSNNSLTGPIPDFLTQLQSLKVLNLGKNNLTGLVPSGLIDRSKQGSLSLSIEQNPNLCESTSCNQQTDDHKKKKKNIAIPIVASVAGILVLLVIVVAAIICGLKKRKPRATVNSQVEPNTPNESQLESKQRQYTFNDLTIITNNFDRILGRGGFGTVYHGLIDDTQVKLLMRVHHKNLTSLIGYCNEDNNIGLIYEYMANGNLDEHLSGKYSRAKLFTWEDRLRIAIDAAQGLEYLHNGCKSPIIHKDVKTTNILLNENFQAKLADFGLSKTFPTDGGTHLSTVVAGTPGYLDPEYKISSRLTEKSDVYSFGVVLLEIITSQPAISKTHEKIHISQWVSSMLSNGDIKNIVDSRLHEDFETSSVWRAVEIGMAPVSNNPARRPRCCERVKRSVWLQS